jgi:hypothetical protein
MSPVGGSRHYAGAGLGQVGLWGCPSCGEDNVGPLEQGCVHCGAGRPGVRAPAPTTPPPPPPEATEATELDEPEQPQARQGDYATIWAEQHPDVSIAEAYRAGVEFGLRTVLAREHAAPPPPPQPEGAPMLDHPQTYRTIVAALAFFRDQILTTNPEEIKEGWWLSAAATTKVIEHLQQLLGDEREVSHV